MNDKLIILFVCLFSIFRWGLYAQPVKSPEVISKLYTHDKKIRNHLITKEMAFNMISTDAVYVLIDSTTMNYKFIRLFTDGKCFISDWYASYPNNSELNDVVYGWRGFYILKEEEIRIEFYLDGYTKYVYYLGNISDGSISVFMRKQRCGGEELALSDVYLIDNNVVLENNNIEW